MNELIKITEKDGRQLVSARELHEFLKIQQDFSDWIKKQLSNIEAVKGLDFTLLKGKTTDLGGRPSVEYILTLDAAKEINMIAGIAPRANEETKRLSKEARKYFIACEKKLKEIKELSPMELMELQFKVLKEQKEKIVQVENKVDKLEEDMPLFQIDCKEIQALVRKKGTEVLGGYRSIAYNDNSLRGKVYSDIQHQIKREFGVTRYEAIKRSQLEKAKEIVNRYRVPLVLEDEIILLNNQIQLIN
ncbi:ORF6C domain-containing protein [Clostridium sp. NSJ-6]|uniref:ORF6C domain-containing protein n=1 Tax=Clostridium hominis TaxID=2763036 RepID=A0ABR7D8U2_9CLOT|nr:ORF6C domain-containing protein [Clostridium hominis]MBC5627575.1 ORF6C domain-containing protein [Clostridium hominis]